MQSRIDNIQKLQSQVESIRNICILAHVDHGKTTLSDCLLTSNGIISSKMSGKARYLDSREDEQERGITMKSSGISLFFSHIKLVDQQKTQSDYLINLIDSPGHVDFSSEVSTASRLCDGALVLVDAVEGVCTQTHTVLRQARNERLKQILVINKIDRLITELKLSPMEAYQHLTKIIEQVNAILGSFEAQELLQVEEDKEYNLDEDIQMDESVYYFAPEKGNVIFASAIDGWAFRIHQFARLYSKKLNIKESLLQRVLWGDFYLDRKEKRVIGRKGLKGRSLKPMFVQFVLENIWQLYDTVLEQQDRPKIESIANTLNVKLQPRDLASKDLRGLLQTIMTQWLPMSYAVLLSVVENIPNPQIAQQHRISSFLSPDTPQDIQQAIMKCDPEGPVIIFVSKMFGVSKQDLPQPKRERLTPEELRLLREQIALKSKQAEGIVEQKQEEVLLGFCRIYSGTVEKGSTVYVLGPKYDPLDPSTFVYKSSATLDRLFLMMGKDLEDLQKVPAGNVFAIQGLQEHVLKTATLTNVDHGPSLASIKLEVAPIVRVAVEPEDPTKMKQVVHGLHLLNMADPAVEIYLEESGENIIACAGELHLERCLKDLRERFAQVDLHVSEPVVPFRETITKNPSLSKEDDDDLPLGTAVVWNAAKTCRIQVRALPLPQNVHLWLQNNKIEHMDKHQVLSALEELYGQKQDWMDNIIVFGPKKGATNVFANAIPDTQLKGFSQDSFSGHQAQEYLQSFLQAFQLATQQGPLCGEPMSGVLFLLEDFEVTPEANLVMLSGQIITSIREAFRKAFLKYSCRLMLAMYSCELQTPSDILGKVYGVLNRRKGRILSEDIKEGTPFFTIQAVMPVFESFGFADELRKKTSGAASPQLLFHGFETLDIDPFWVPTTEEELEDLGEKADRENQAKKYMDAVRRRKGMHVDQKIVEHAEKQKTLKSQ
ncbi:P-loop containing nucleoside triphosphate hydrolase protein, partial [Gorgonomyces haynaldii]